MTIFGWDLSHFDAPGIGTAVADGIAFLTHKAGGDRDDPELGEWWAGVRGLDPNRVLLGAYWVLLPGHPERRADEFLARLDAACPGWRDRPFILQVDCEKWRGDQGTVPNRFDIKDFCDRLAARMPKLRPIVYAPKWVYGDGLTGLGYPLWASSYVSGPISSFKGMYPGDSSSRWGAYSGQTPAILQYTSSATIGGQTTCDANAYRGTLAELTALVAPGWTEDTVEAKDVWTEDIIPVNGKTATWQAAGTLGAAYDKASAAAAGVARLEAAVAQLAGRDLVDEPAIVAGVLAGLDPVAIAAAVVAALPADEAKKVADELAARLAA